MRSYFKTSSALLILCMLLAGCAGPAFPRILYLVPEEVGGDVWIRDGVSNLQLTFTDGMVYDYTVSPDGKTILFSRINGENGLDLWQMPIGGGTPHLVLNCGRDWCFEVNVSSDNRTAAYSRKEFSTSPGGDIKPRIWILALGTSETRPLYSDVFIAGEKAIWAPGGKRISFFDPDAGGFRIIDIHDGGSQFIYTRYNGMDWSPDGKQIAIVELIALDAEEYTSRLLIVNVDTRVMTALEDPSNNQTEFSAPVWSPDGKYLAVGWRYPGGSPGKQLKIIAVEAVSEQEVTNDMMASHTAYHWLRDGSGLVFQRLILGRSDAEPEIWIWETATNRFDLLVSNGALPIVLP